MGTNDLWMNRMEQHLNDRLTSFQQELRAEMEAFSLGVTKEISEMKQKMDEILRKFDEIGKYSSGSRFSEMFLEKFSGPGGENRTGAFLKLQQHGSAEEYSLRFLQLKESAVQMYSNLRDEFFMKCFMRGLKEDFRYTVQLMNPNTISQAIQFTGALEKWLEAAKSKGQEEDCGLRGSSSRKNLPVRRLTCEEIESRRSRGLCFNCDEIYFTEHNCKNLFVIMGKEEVAVSESEGESEDENYEDYQISVHAPVSSNPDCIKVLGKVKNKNLLIFVATGSTNSFLDIQTARRLGCELEYTNPSMFTVADGEMTDCHAKCNGFQWKMGGHTFSADLWVLELGGDDMILGTDFLTTLGPFLFDGPTMKILQYMKVIKLQLLAPEVSARMNHRRKLKSMQRKNQPLDCIAETE